MLYGAIAGDIAGSTYEFTGMPSADAELFPKGSTWTDDTVLTLAIASALSADAYFQHTLFFYGSLYRHPMGGYGLSFDEWLDEGLDAPAYNSFGNGSAMRVSPCAYAARTLEEAITFARKSAEVTHNHPEGIKGAEATAACIFLARTGKTKEDIKQYIHENYYDMSRTYEDLRKAPYEMHEICQDTVPEAIICFLYSEDFESAIRMAMLTNKDTDTAAAITGAIAEAYYGVPEYIKTKVRDTLPDDLLEILDEFEGKVRSGQRFYYDWPPYQKPKH